MNKTLMRILSVLSTMFFVVSAFAQVTTSALGGSITDENGEALAGAAVIAKHVPSGSQYFAVANSEGLYSIKGMRTGGPYEVTYSLIGQQTVVVKDITLSLGETYQQDVVLPMATETLSEVVVVASVSKFSNEKTGPATNISSTEITSMPTVSRSIESVAKLSPYANGMGFAGGDGRSSNFTVDGANFNNNFGLSDGLPGGGNPISIDAIQEIQVVVAPYDVRQTNFIGGGVNAVTKSGTNTFKATAYATYYGLGTHGKKAMGEDASAIPTEYGKQLYGATIGGPIVKDKLFFFVSGEYGMQPNTFQSWRGSTDGVANASKYISRVKLEDLANVQDCLQKVYGYDTGSYTDFPATTTDIRALARLDWNINDSNRLALRYNFTRHKNWQATNGSSSNCGTRASGNRFSQYGMSYLNTCYYFNNDVHTVSLDLNSKIGDNMNNQFLATYSYIQDIRGSNSDEFPMVDILCGDDLANGKITPYISAGYELFSYNNAVKNGILTIKDDFTYDLASHHFLAGLSYERQYANNSFNRNGTGYYRWKSLEDFYKASGYDPVTHTVTTPDTSILPETVALTYGYNGNTNPTDQVTFNQIGAYVQDDWDISKRFKINLGVRFDTILFDTKDIMTNNAIKAIDYGGKSIDTGVWPKTNVMISPRLGFVWDVMGDKSLKFRGGAGLFTGRLPLVYFTNMPGNSNMSKNVTSATTTWKGKNGTADDILANFGGKMITDRTELLNKLNSLDASRYPLNIDPSKGVAGSTVCAVDPNFKMPMVAKVSLGVDYEIPVDFPFTVSAEGMYTKTINGLMMQNYNIKSDDSDSWERMAGPDNRLIYPENFKYTKTNAYVLTNTQEGYGYTANVTVNMRPVRDLSIMAAYTRTESKEITGMPGSDASSVFTSLYSVNGAQFATLQRSQYVLPDRVIANINYNHNFTKLDGFTTHISLMYEGYSSGGYSFYYDSDINGDGTAYDLIYIPNSPDELKWASVDDMMNFWNFVNQDPYLRSHKGQYAEAYAARAPWYHRVDMRLAQDVGVKVGRNLNRLQFSIDFMNVGNMLNSNWGLPSVLDCNSGKILHVTNVDEVSSTVAPIYSFAAGSDHTYTTSLAFSNCWQIQFGVRYMFN